MANHLECCTCPALEWIANRVALTSFDFHIDVAGYCAWRDCRSQL